MSFISCVALGNLLIPFELLVVLWNRDKNIFCVFLRVVLRVKEDNPCKVLCLGHSKCLVNVSHDGDD